MDSVLPGIFSRDPKALSPSSPYPMGGVKARSILASGYMSRTLSWALSWFGEIRPCRAFLGRDNTKQRRPQLLGPHCTC